MNNMEPEDYFQWEGYSRGKLVEEEWHSFGTGNVEKGKFFTLPFDVRRPP